MQKEIKEILDKWKCYIGLTKKFSNNDMELLRVEDIEKVLDYITNLQQENEKLKDNLETMTFTAKIKQQAVDSLITKIDKAIEYIENDLQISILPNNQIINGKEVIKRINKIINILQGKDNGKI